MYCCRGFPLNGDDAQAGQAFHIMMLIEKVSQHRQIDLEKLRSRFQLTNRQMEIVKHLFSGLTNKRIADALCVSEDTIKGHLKHIMRRLKVNSRTEILSIILQL
jgi:DNA-binding NarL/FixJ family response regulator